MLGARKPNSDNGFNYIKPCKLLLENCLDFPKVSIELRHLLTERRQSFNIKYVTGLHVHAIE